MEIGASDPLTRSVIGCFMRVHSTLGPGFAESIYKRGAIVELKRQRIAFETEKEIPIFYEGEKIGCHKLDLLIAGKLVVELKVAESLGRHQYAQVRSYLKATNLPVGLLVNFAGESLDARRIENRHLAPSRSPQIPSR